MLRLDEAIRLAWLVHYEQCLLVEAVHYLVKGADIAFDNRPGSLWGFKKA